MFKTIVVAIDGSEPSKRAVQAACALAKAFEGEVHLVHALDNKSGDVPMGRKDSAGEKSGSAIVEEAVSLAESHGVSPSSTTIGEGESYDEIMTITQLYGADLIVTGRRGLGNISGLFAGSTSQKIAKNAACAFLSVK